MPFVDPQTVNNPTAGQPATAAWGDSVRDAVVYLATGKPRARVYNSANFAVTTAVVTPVTFDSERYDVGGCHSTATNTSRLTVPAGEGGLYEIGGNIQWAANATGERIADIRLNGTTFIGRVRMNAGASQTHTQQVFSDYQLAAGDFVELTVYQNSGGNLNVQVLASHAIGAEFWWKWVAT